MTDEEAGHLAENLWLYRVRRRISRQTLTARLIKPETYRDYEYGAAIPSHDEVEVLARRLRTTPEALLQPPDFKWLLKNQRVRKMLELFCQLQSKRHRDAMIQILRAMEK